MLDPARLCVDQGGATAIRCAKLLSQIPQLAGRDDASANHLSESTSLAKAAPPLRCLTIPGRLQNALSRPSILRGFVPSCALFIRSTGFGSHEDPKGERKCFPALSWSAIGPGAIRVPAIPKPESALPFTPERGTASESLLRSMITRNGVPPGDYFGLNRRKKLEKGGGCLQTLA